MKFSLDWLREYVDLPEEPARVAELLADAGLPVDTVERWGADHCLDVDVMANRPDCMCHVGLARELTARLGRPLKVPAVQPDRGRLQAAELAGVEISDPDLCPRYSALILTGIRVERSPDWLEDRLASIGQRPINNIVDVTNFVLHELGQPLHAFDLDRLEGGRIQVRPARNRESLQTLDGETRHLGTDDLIIADAVRPVALAGVMGGADTEISTRTTRVLLESAHFSPRAVRRTARRLGLRTDASHRFERGSDAGITLDAALRAAALILETAGGELAAGDLDVQPRPMASRALTLTLSRVTTLLGMPVDAETVSHSLASLGFAVDLPEWSGGDALFRVQVPSWRVDVEREVDLIEEVARMVGYDAIPATLPAMAAAHIDSRRPTALLDRARRFLAAAGFAEAINFPMSDRQSQEPFAEFLGSGRELVRLENPMSHQMDTMRASLIPGLVVNLVHNWNRGREDVRLFEAGRLFAERNPEDRLPGAREPGDRMLPLERTAVAALACGGRQEPHWGRQWSAVDFFDIKGVVEELAHCVLGCRVRVENADDDESLSFLAPDVRARVCHGERVIGFLGRLRPTLPQVADVPAEVLVFELDLSDGESRTGGGPRQPLHRHPAADRDLAFFMKAGTPYDQVEQVVRKEGGTLLEAVVLFDRYFGPPVPAGQVSLAIRLTFRHPERTLTADEVQEIQDRIVRRLTSELDALLRDS
jgi:phenylalanyl-tRNA synthetase beta chain